MIPLLLLACAPAAVGTADDTGAAGPYDGNEGPYITEGEQTEAPDIDLAAVGEALDQALAQVFALNAAGVLDAYGAVTAGGDATCPEWYQSDGLPYWYDSCRSEDGTAFEGYAYLVEYDDYAAEDGNRYTGAQLYGIASVVAPDGRTFSASGGAGLFAVQGADGAEISYSYLEDGFYDSAAEGTFLAGPLDASLVTYASWYDELGAGGLYLDGTITGLDGLLEVVVFEDLGLSHEEAGGCEAEPTATLSVLDGEGQWLDLVFSAELGAEDPLCDGCGTAYLHGQVAGQVCADFSVLLDWEQSPWW